MSLCDSYASPETRSGCRRIAALVKLVPGERVGGVTFQRSVRARCALSLEPVLMALEVPSLIFWSGRRLELPLTVSSLSPSFLYCPVLLHFS